MSAFIDCYPCSDTCSEASITSEFAFAAHEKAEGETIGETFKSVD